MGRGQTTQETLSELRTDLSNLFECDLQPLSTTRSLVGNWLSWSCGRSREDGTLLFNRDGTVIRTYVSPTRRKQLYYRLPIAGILLFHESRQHLALPWDQAPCSENLFAFASNTVEKPLVLSNDDSSVLKVLTPIK